MRRYINIIIIIIIINALILNINAQPLSQNKSDSDKKIAIPNIFSKLNSKIIFFNSLTKMISLNKNKIINDNIWDFSFSPEDIELKDDAFHRTDDLDLLHYTEWWYFDAVFENGYSVQMTIRVLSLLNQELFIFSRLDIYKNTTLISHNQEIHFLEDFYASTEVPYVKLNGKEMINGYINKDNGEWTYDISFNLKNSSAILNFVGCTKGYKGTTPGGKWAVILPRAKVNGTLLIDGKQIDVQGIGYHDHNWEVTAEAALNFGWYWGRINSNNYTFVWADILTTWYWGQPLLVINEKNGSYQNIEQKDIQFSIGKVRLSNKMIIPQTFKIKVKTDNISIDLYMDSLNVHYDPFFNGIMNYWRYHMDCKGFINIGSQTEIIDDIIIAEFLKFRPY
jgi:predicted secreted hydrolase